MRIYTHEDCIEHAVAPGHPERPERLRYLLDYLERTGLAREFPLLEANPAADETILAAHPPAHLAFLRELAPDAGVVPVDPDTWLGPRSLRAARLAAGAVCDAVDAVLDGADDRAFCAVRPPGHHAERAAAMGFCLLNSVAIGVHRALARGIERAAVLDFDVHHGNGTVDIFMDDPRVLVCSSFQHPFYPHRLYDVDRPNIVNTPLPAGTGSSDFRRAIRAAWPAAIEKHRPELIFVSAGFDAHRRDPLANLDLDEDDFFWITEQICQAADEHCGGRIVSALEGGYDLEALAASVHAHLNALAGG